MQADKPTYEMLEERVRKLEAAVQECERLSAANRHAAAIMHEVNNPLEAVTNLAYLIEQEMLTAPAREYLGLLQEQLVVLTAVTRPSLAFHREQRAAALVDLAALIDSVGKLHAGRLQTPASSCTGAARTGRCARLSAASRSRCFRTSC